MPQLSNGHALNKIRVKIDPADQKVMPVFKPQLALTKTPIFLDDSFVKLVSQGGDLTAKPSAWSAPHWIETEPHEIIDTENYDYLLHFVPFDGKDCGPILATEFIYD